MSGFENESHGAVASSLQHSTVMDAGEAPSYGDDVAAVPLQRGYIHMQTSQVQNLPPATAFSSGSSASMVLPNRMQLLQEAVQLSTVAPSTRDEKMDVLLSMMSAMFKLMLLDAVEGRSGGSSPLSLLLSSTNSSASSGVDPSSPSEHPATAAAHFMCPACPSSNHPITEKSFKKHIEAWKKKIRGGVSRRKSKPGSCPGILNVSHPLVAGLKGDVTHRVDEVVDHTVSLLTPGANAAHTPTGTGNFQRVQQYFDFLTSLPH